MGFYGTARYRVNKLCEMMFFTNTLGFAEKLTIYF
ncbi:hypothetical protein SAMN05444280_1681 [Tangfeifania diversioriginum]|uniref:Uncharacterized protein n=1 Tax=Tangfeifania diversioriginum TaxID=1168035 RepID=A0A1M6PQ17_9BACT|nr:hypothetical protein SAMN05444280_1681 [Tangfeifania diversioriginum]